MGIFEPLRRFLGGPGAVYALSREASVAALLPTDAVYATAGMVASLPDAQAFTGGPPGSGAYGRDLGWIPGDQEPSLLACTAEALLVVTEHGVAWQRQRSDVVALDAHRRGGFVTFMRDGSGLAVSVQTPVQVPPGRSLRTVGRTTNAFGGWDAQLEVACHW